MAPNSVNTHLKLLTEYHLESLSLKEGRTGTPESTPVKMPHCWKSHATAHIVMRIHTHADPSHTRACAHVHTQHTHTRAQGDTYDTC